MDSTLKLHPLANLFPPMAERDYHKLKVDIEANGLREPITIFEGKILDGRHRYRACRELGIRPKLREWRGQSSILEFVLSMNLHRRHLTTSQRALVGAELKQLFELDARRRQGARTDLRAELRGGMVGKASEQAARLVNVSARSIENASAVKRANAPALVAAVKHGLVSVSMAVLIAKLPADDQAKVLSLGSNAEKRRALYLYGKPDFRRSLDEAVQAMLIIKSVLKSVEEVADLIGDHSPQLIAQTFIQWFPWNDARMVRAFERGTKAARLFAEIDRLWSDGARD